MQKLLAAVMATLVLVSTTGVTVACTVCERTGRTVTMCQKCEDAPGGVSVSAKSCCATSTQRIAVKDSFVQPVEPLIVVPVASLIYSAVSMVSLAGTQAPAFVSFSLHVSSAREFCALTSTFRI